MVHWGCAGKGLPVRRETLMNVVLSILAGWTYIALAIWILSRESR